MATPDDTTETESGAHTTEPDDEIRGTDTARDADGDETPERPPRRRRKWAAVLRPLGGVALVLLLWPAAWGGPFGFVVPVGTSMEPTYRTGDVVLITSLGTPQLGDVLVYQPTGDGGRIIHRAVAYDPEEGWTTRGDNRTTNDQFTPSTDELDGRVILDTGPVGRFVFIYRLPLLAGIIAAYVTTTLLRRR